jgi:hypothetical protein
MRQGAGVSELASAEVGAVNNQPTCSRVSLTHHEPSGHQPIDTCVSADMKRVEADGGLRDAFAGHRQVDAAAVQADRLHVSGAGWADGVEGPGEAGLGAVLADPHHVAGVVVGDDREVAVAAPVGDLVHPDAVQPVEADVVDVRGDHPRDGVLRLFFVPHGFARPTHDHYWPMCPSIRSRNRST